MVVDLESIPLWYLWSWLMFFEVRGTWFRLETKTGAWVHVVSTLSLVIYPSFSISIFRTNFFWTFFLSPRFDKHPHLAILWKHKNISSLALFSRRRQWHPTPVLLPGKSHGWRSLVGCSPWGREKSDTTERLHFHFSLSCWRRKWQPTPVFLSGESQGRGSLMGCCLWGRTESDTTEAT